MISAGTNDPDEKDILVLLPGMDGTGVLFAPLLSELDPRISPWVVPFPSDQPLSYDELLPLVRRALPSGEPFFLLAESFSGPLAIKLAAEAPGNLRALILVSTFIRNPLPWLPSCARLAAVTPVFHAARHFILLKALLSGYGSPGLNALLRSAHGDVEARVMAKRAREILAVDVRRELKSVRAPIYFIGGQSDRVVPSKNLRELTAVRPDIVVKKIPGPHLILQVNPARAALEIGRILSREKTFPPSAPS